MNNNNNNNKGASNCKIISYLNNREILLMEIIPYLILMAITKIINKIVMNFSNNSNPINNNNRTHKLINLNNNNRIFYPNNSNGLKTILEAKIASKIIVLKYNLML